MSRGNRSSDDPGNGNSGNPHGIARHTSSEMEQVLEKVARLDRCGWTQYEIALEIGVNQPMVSVYLRTIRTRYSEATIEQYSMLVEEKRQQLRDIRKEAWKAYLKSHEGIEKVTEIFEAEKRETPVNPHNRRGRPRRGASTQELENTLRLLKRVVIKEGRLPANEFLELIRRTIMDECHLLGLLKDKNPNTPAGTLNWDALIGRVDGSDPVNQLIEQVIEGQAQQLENPQGNEDHGNNGDTRE